MRSANRLLETTHCDIGVRRVKDGQDDSQVQLPNCRTLQLGVQRGESDKADGVGGLGIRPDL